jgi:hypothetical protein
MNTERDRPLNAPMQAALDELRGTIRQLHPDACFRIRRGPENAESIELVVTVDLDDPFDVLDAVIDRVVDLQVDHGLPVHVIPVHSPERMEALRRQGDVQRARGEVPVA